MEIHATHSSFRQNKYWLIPNDLHTLYQTERQFFVEWSEMMIMYKVVVVYFRAATIRVDLNM